MKNIVLTFDDGRFDIIDNVLPVLKSFHLPATFYLTSGYINGDVKQDFEKVIGINDLNIILDNDCEIGLHSYSHLHQETVSDYCRGLVFLNTALKGKYQIRTVATPYFQIVDEDSLNFFEKNNILVVRSLVCKPSPNFITKLLVLINLFLKSDKIRNRIKSIGYRKAFYKKSKKMNEIKTINVTRDMSLESLIDIIKLVPNNLCVTLTFHSIYKHDEFPYDEYFDGSWPINDFISLCKFLSTTKGINVIRQKDTIVNG